MSALPTLAEIESIAPGIDAVVPPTPQYSWPLLNARAGCELWVKHENHTAIGSFKIRGSLNYINQLVAREPGVRGVIAATRGNYGQAVAFAASRHRLPATILVPHGNSVEKNRAMRALGAELIEHGEDFQAALVRSEQLAAERGLHWMPAYHRDLAWGNAVSMLQFLRKSPALDTVYISTGMGSGICALIAARDALGLATRIVGVVSARAPAVALSFEAGRLIPHPRSLPTGRRRSFCRRRPRAPAKPRQVRRPPPPRRHCACRQNRRASPPRSPRPKRGPRARPPAGCARATRRWASSTPVRRRSGS